LTFFAPVIESPYRLNSLRITQVKLHLRCIGSANQVGLQMSEKSLTPCFALFAAIVAISAVPLFGQAPYRFVVGSVKNQFSAATVSSANNIFAAGNHRIGGGMANQGATYCDGVPANSAPGNLVNIAPNPNAILEFGVHAALTIATYRIARMDLNPKVSTMGAAAEVATQSTHIQADGNAVANGMEAQGTKDVPSLTQNPLFYAMLQNGAQPRSGTFTSTLGDL
jgi:hypothetical protein